MHVDHCLETLRIGLMCQSDITPLRIIDGPTAPLGSRADFNAHHKCRDFEILREWMEENMGLAEA
jgi:hypothetical protein